MPRQDYRIHEYKPPVVPRPAATILLLRDTERGLEVLMTRRSMHASFAPGAFVFPGGALDAADQGNAARRLSRARESQSHEQQAFTVAAIREAFEELGVLLARRPDGTPAGQGHLDRLSRDLKRAPSCARLWIGRKRPATEQGKALAQGYHRRFPVRWQSG